MYTFCIIMIAIASILLILAVLVQSPKSGMAANFGAANQTMGVRQTTDFLEKFTWAMVAAVVFFSLLSTTANPRVEESKSSADMNQAAIENALQGDSANEAGTTPVVSGEEVTEPAVVNETEVTETEVTEPTEPTAEVTEPTAEVTEITEVTETEE